MTDATLRGYILAFLTRLEQRLDTETFGKGCGLVATGHHETAIARRGGPNCAHGIASSKSAPFGRTKRRNQSLLGGIEILDEHYHPGAHSFPHRSRIRGNICEPYSFKNRAWSFPGA